MERWLADRPSQPGEFSRQWLKDLYQENKLIKDEFVLDGRTVRLKDITCPVLNIYTETDHIIPPEMSQGLRGTGRHRGLYRGAPQGWPYRHLRQRQSTGPAHQHGRGLAGQAVKAGDADLTRNRVETVAPRGAPAGP